MYRKSIHLFLGMMKRHCFGLEVWKMCSASSRGKGGVFKGSVLPAFLTVVCCLVLGMPATYAGASGGYALEFDGQDDQVATNEQYLFINETGQFSASAWVHVYQHAVSNETWNSVLGTGHAGPFRMAVIQDGQVRCTWDGASRVDLYSDPVPVDQWIHILVQGDGSILQLYIDGRLVDEANLVPQAQTKRPNFA
ncbi:MAG: LamG domain-containing protein, partial [Planctomycetes bacterium]|nr:LamG domain-containing protein [Planctomycetota bacterium]